MLDQLTAPDRLVPWPDDPPDDALWWAILFQPKRIALRTLTVATAIAEHSNDLTNFLATLDRVAIRTGQCGDGVLCDALLTLSDAIRNWEAQGA